MKWPGLISLVVSAVICLSAVLWAVRARGEAGLPDFPAHTMSSPPASIAQSYMASSMKKWPEPPSQSSGPAWIFDVFTPPIIFFHPEDQTFELTPPRRKDVPNLFELTPLRFERGIYRLQYAAHVGDPGRYVIEVRDVEGDRWVRGRVGESLPGLEARIVSFDARRQLSTDESSGWEVTALNRIYLVLYDERLEAELTVGQETRLSDEWSVLCEHSQGTRLLSMGENFTGHEAPYRIQKMDTETGRVWIERYPVDASEPEVRLFQIHPVTSVDSINNLH